MGTTKAILGILVFAACLAWYAWVSDRLRSKQARHDFSGTRISSSAAPDEGVPTTELWVEPHPEDVPPDRKRLIGSQMGEPTPQPKGGNRYVISRDYRIKYSRQVYVNTPFELSVVFAEPGTLRKSEPRLTIRDGRVLFQATEQEPKVKVEISFAPGTFETNETMQEKQLKKRGSTLFSFWIKPLKSQDCLLTVSISYAAQLQVPEKIEQIQITTVQEDYGEQKTTTTLIKSPRTQCTVYPELDRVTLNVSVVGFLGLNAHEIGLLGKGLGAMITVLIVIISYFTGRGFDWLEAIEFLILGIATPLGITVYDGLKGTLKTPKPEESG